MKRGCRTALISDVAKPSSVGLVMGKSPAVVFFYSHRIVQILRNGKSFFVFASMLLT